MTDGSNYIGKHIGNYHVVAELSSGAFGSVYLAQHELLAARSVAIKLLHSMHLGSEQERDRFLREAQFLEVLKHPHILPLIDLGIDNGVPYLVTEYAPNGSLRDRLERQPTRPLPLEEAVTILSQIGQALQHAHQRHIIHCDLKPENILFNAKNEALLVDFGIALVLASTSAKHVPVVGTPVYMAPEQFRGTVSKDSDQYALGCIAYELFTGCAPFSDSNLAELVTMHMKAAPLAPTQLNPQLPVHIERAVLKAIAKQRADRHTDISAFITALHASAPTQAAALTIITEQHRALVLRAQKTKEQWVDEGNAHYRARRYAEALEAYERAIALDPQDAFFHYHRGNALRRLKRYEEALVSFEQAIQLHPNDASSHYYRGRVLYALKRYEAALAAFEHAIELDPNLAYAYNWKGNALRHLKRCEESLLAHGQAIALDPNDILFHYNKGIAFYTLKRYEEALVAYGRAVELDPNSANVHNARGSTLYGLKRYEEALAAYERAVELDPYNVSFHKNKGSALYGLKRYAEALTAYEQAIQLEPDDASAYSGKGIALEGMWRYQQALEAYEQAIRLNPYEAVYHRNRGDALRALYRNEEALAAYERALELDPDNATLHHKKGRALKRLGRLEEAEKAEERAKQLGYRG